MTKIEIPNTVTLDGLIEANILHEIESRVVVYFPHSNQLNLTDEQKNEVREAAEFIQEKETQSSGNRFAQRDLINDSTLAEARRVVLDFIQKAQKLHNAAVTESNKKYELSDKFQADVNALIHAKKVTTAVEALREATKSIHERIKEIPIPVDLNGHYDKDVISYFALEAVYRLHSKEE